MANASQCRQPRKSARLLACLAIASVSPASAIGLGDMEVASSLGQTLDASVALAPGEGESVARECFSLTRGAAGAAPFVTRATLSLETAAGATRLRIRSAAPISEPAVTLRVNASCPGGALVTRDYVVLLDPQPGRTPLVVAPAAVTRAAPSEAATPSPKLPKPAPVSEARPPVPAPVTAPKTLAPMPAPAAAQKTAVPAPAQETSRSASRAFALRLSAPEIDLARTRGVSEQARAQLRERQAILDAGDPVAALLTLRDSMKVLENRVAQLQLKLSGMTPPAPAAPKAEVPVAKVEPPPAPKVEPPPAPKVEPPPAPKIEPPPAPKIEAPSSEPATAKARPVPTRPATRAPESEGSALPAWLWGVVGLLVLAIAWIALRLRRRRTAGPAFEPEEPAPSESAAPRNASVSAGRAFDVDAPAPTPEPAPAHVPARRMMDSDASLATSVTAGDPSDLRRRYIEERFPEIGAHTIILEEPDSIVKGARLFYEDGSVTRAVELLQYSIEEKPGELKRWLALFEIFRLERLASEFAELASRFRDYHGESEYWAKVQFFGREIDPANPLYQEEAFSDIETIGVPTAARKLHALAFDPLAENWLNAPMDFSSEVLATELRQKLMAEAGVHEADLIPNPMSALKNVEMFTVA